MILHVICTAFNRATPLRVLVDSFILQTDPRWKMYVIHDGKPPIDVMNVMNTYTDPRIKFLETATIQGYYGHPNRKIVLDMIPNNYTDYILMTNDDNYYVPQFIRMVMKPCKSKVKRVGMVYCDTVHSYLEYGVLKTEVKEDMIDMGSFIVRSDIAHKVGFNYKHFNADGTFAVKCAEACRRIKLDVVPIRKALFVHN